MRRRYESRAGGENDVNVQRQVWMSVERHVESPDDELDSRSPDDFGPMPTVEAAVRVTPLEFQNLEPWRVLEALSNGCCGD